MRKTSQDGGDSTSITSGLGIMKSTRNSIKRKVQSLSHESDDGVIEPLLQKDKENSIPLAKFSLAKTKTDQTSDKGKDNQAFKVNLTDIKPSTAAACSTKDTKVSDATSVGVDYYRNAYSSVAPYRTYVPTVLEPVSEQVLVSIDGSKTAERANSPLIFTTAKIHADTKSNQTEQVRVTPSSLSKTESIDSKQSVTLHSNDKTVNKTHNIENDKAINKYQDTNKIEGSVSVNIIKETFQTPVTKFNVELETKKQDINLAKGTGLPTATANTVASVRDSVNTTKTAKAEPTIKIESISDSKLENNKVQVNAKCVALENVSVEIKKPESKLGHSVTRNDIDGIDINKNVQSKGIASMAGSINSLEGASTTKAIVSDKKNDKPLQRQKTSSIEGNDPIKAKPSISSVITAGAFPKSEDTKNSFKLPSLNKKSVDDKASTIKPATCVTTKSNDSKPTVNSSITTRSSTKTITVSAVSKTSSSNSVKPLGATPKAVTTTASSDATPSVAKPSKVSTVSTIHNAGPSGSQSKDGNKESATKPTDLKLGTEKERDRNVVNKT